MNSRGMNYLLSEGVPPEFVVYLKWYDVINDERELYSGLFYGNCAFCKTYRNCVGCPLDAINENCVSNLDSLWKHYHFAVSNGWSNRRIVNRAKRMFKTLAEICRKAGITWSEST